jgi:hypothetical protein
MGELGGLELSRQPFLENGSANKSRIIALILRTLAPRPEPISRLMMRLSAVHYTAKRAGLSN